MAAIPSVMADLPSPSLFQFPPHPEPQAIPPPHFELPFVIPDHIYRAALDPRVPLTVAAVYAVSAKLINSYNKSTGKKPWAISKTQGFKLFVVLHNIFLAVYSAWTFYGMFVALRNSIASPTGPNGLAGTVDSFCKFHGPAGLGNAVAYDQTTGKWEGANFVSGEPSRTQGGRLWNEGLAFYGWIFYLSKFYEVLDTFIILAKGKFSSTLQTYHHAGAMMCMWAGMRYMSAPIWMFVFVNSGIHAMMYTYYTITAFNIRVPQLIKRTLTTMQITQFLVGATYAMAHSFVSYTQPVLVPLQNAAASAAAGTASGAALVDKLRQMVFGVAEAANAGAVTSAAADAGFEVRYETVPCITSTGATFAIWLNVLYLAPLTYLFVSFFIASYIRRTNAEAKRVQNEERAHRINEVTVGEKAAWDAAKGLEREVYGQEGVTEESVRALRSRTNGAAKTNGQAQ